jgi:hypothetical protein
MMARRCGSFLRSVAGIAAAAIGLSLGASDAGAQASQATAADLKIERALAAAVSEAKMVGTVRTLVAFGTRMYGTPSNQASAGWLADAFRQAGLEVEVRKDTPRDWYQPVAWEVRAAAAALKTTWPYVGSPSSKGVADLSIDAAAGAVCLLSKPPTPETTTGCVAALFDGRASASGWPGIGRLRGTWTIPVFAVSPGEAGALRERLTAGEKVRVSFSLEAATGNGPAHTVVATLPGKDRTKYILFCAHADSDSGGPGADDNASGVAAVLEIARTAAAAVKAGRMPRPAWDLRFAAWGGEISSTREYLATMEKDPAKLQAVINYDQAGFGASKDALYVEPDDVPVNGAIITLVRGVMADHLKAPGFPERAASVKTQGGTDSYVFQNTRTPGGPLYPSVTLYTSAWDRERTLPVTAGFPPLNWYPGEKEGMVTVDGDPFYHSAGDTPANTTDSEPSNMGWCARVGLLSALRLMR